MAPRSRGPSWLPRLPRLPRGGSVTLVFLLIVAFQVVFAALSIQILASVRAYVTGESLYSKGQKDALLHIQSWVETHDEADYQRFLQAISVPEGDARARHALQQPNPDRARARAGFLAGQNHPADIDGMIRLFLVAHDVPFMARAIAIWSEGDAAIAALHARVDAARRAVQAGRADAPEVVALVDLLPAANARLTLLERRFSDELGLAARLVHRLLLAGNLAIAALLAVTGSRYIRRTLHAIQQREAETVALMHAVHEGVLTVEADGRVVLFNRAAERLFGCEADAALGAPLDRFIREGLPALPGPLPAEAIGTVHELTGVRADGAVLHLEASLAQVRTAGGLRTTLLCRDVTGQRQARERERAQLLQRNAELRRKAYTDPLTGLPNREALERHLADALAHPPADQPVSVLFLDLDGFKAVNDTHGHPGGDEVLRQVAQRLREAVRRQDEVFRISGDEFVILVTQDATPATAEALARRALAAIREPYAVGRATARVTVSVGLASFPEDGTDARSLLRAADAAMYRVKQSGKDDYRVRDPSDRVLDDAPCPDA